MEPSGLLDFPFLKPVFPIELLLQQADASIALFSAKLEHIDDLAQIRAGLGDATSGVDLQKLLDVLIPALKVAIPVIVDLIKKLIESRDSAGVSSKQSRRMDLAIERLTTILERAELL